MNAQRREGKRAPPDPPILADAKGGRRTEGRAGGERGRVEEGKRADDDIVLQKKKKNPALNAGANNKKFLIFN